VRHHSSQIFQPKKLKRLHDVWLAEIKNLAKNRAKDSSSQAPVSPDVPVPSNEQIDNKAELASFAKNVLQRTLSVPEFAFMADALQAPPRYR
jgi:hypothetical protein